MEEISFKLSQLKKMLHEIEQLVQEEKIKRENCCCESFTSATSITEVKPNLVPLKLDRGLGRNRNSYDKGLEQVKPVLLDKIQNNRNCKPVPLTYINTDAKSTSGLKPSYSPYLWAGPRLHLPLTNQKSVRNDDSFKKYRSSSQIPFNYSRL